MVGTLWGRDLYAAIFAASFVSFAILFFTAWGVSAYVFRRVWPRFLVEEKADWASRVNSQIHAMIVVVGFLTTLSTTDYSYTTWYNDNSSTIPSSIIMSISLGYFSFDFLVLIYYRVPLWVVFVFHHIVASVPYYVYVFHPCDAGNLVLSAFLLVEFATFFLNFQTWMEKLGLVRSRWFTWMFYCTYVAWFLTRVLLPVFLLYVVWNIFLSDLTVQRNLRMCLIPGLTCAHLITLFCWVVFFFVLTPDVVHRARQSPEAMEAYLQEAKRRRRQLLAEASRGGTPSPNGAGGASTPHTTPSGEITRQSPNRLPSGNMSRSGSMVVFASDGTPSEHHEPVEFEVSDHQEDDGDEVVVDAPMAEEGVDYELLVRTVLTDNPYRTRPEGRRNLSTMSLREIRHEGISLEARTTVYATTTFRL